MVIILQDKVNPLKKMYTFFFSLHQFDRSEENIYSISFFYITF